jgi:hypothetical protein
VTFNDIERIRTIPARESGELSGEREDGRSTKTKKVVRHQLLQRFFWLEIYECRTARDFKGQRILLLPKR